MESSLDFIVNLGFKKAGKWVLDDNGKTKPDFVEDREKFLYAFVVDEIVMYVGATSRALKDRMKEYCGSDPNGANYAMHQSIKSVLEKSKELLIYTMSSENIKQNIEGIIDLIDFAAGLEKSIIQKLDPQWNKHGRTK